ncbi:MAG: type II toxin-antitoxin system prevent-host-death family antitoxin [Chloroflexi bacterium]|nr:type II toxin-antitoxin system prevent-host-death family antitoxin [Chloroflexota bacterium]
MREQEPTTQTLEAAKARQHWSELLDRVARNETRVIVEKSGVRVAAIISPEDLERFEQLERERERRWSAFLAIGDRSGAQDPEEVERLVAEEIESLRAEERARTAASPGA